MDRAVFERMNEQETTHWWFVARRKIITAALKRFVTLPEHPRILEAGAGTGGNLAMLAEMGEVSAFEYDESARIIASHKSGIAVAAGALPDGIPFEGQTFDLIVLLDVLEHIEEDTASLAALSQYLAPGGRIFVTVPAFQWLWSHHDVTHHHFRRYSHHSLSETVESAGLELERTFYFNSFLFPLVIVTRALKTLVGSKSADDTKPSPAVNAALQGVFASEVGLIGRVRMPFGLSLGGVIKTAEAPKVDA